VVPTPACPALSRKPVGTAGTDQVSPVLEFGLPGRRLVRQIE
jgi:hypothetical protein